MGRPSFARSLTTRVAFGAALATGRYADRTVAEKLADQREMVSFRGDVPPMAGREHDQRRLAFRIARPLQTTERDLSYTPIGMAWIRGRLERRCSFEEVGLRQLLSLPRAPVRRIERATILEAQTPRTYGDWMSEHVAILALALQKSCFVAPLLLPEVWYRKSYVRRDLETLGIEAQPVDGTVRVAEANVLHKLRPGHYWTTAEAEATREAMNIVAAPVRPGSAVYLSRRGERGEGPQRQINNVVTEAAMEASGVRVVRTVGRTREDFIALAGDAETLFADHGSAMYNMLYWQTRRIVEFFTPTYWDSAFLFLADGLGISDYHLWQIDSDTQVESLSKRIARLREQPVL